MEKLFEAFYKKRLSSLEYACDGSPLACPNSNELTVLGLLADRGPLVMGQLSEDSGLAMSTLTGITDKLTRMTLLERCRDEKDKRIVRVSLTDEGREAYRVRMEAKIDVCREILSPLNAEERRQFLNLMEKIVG